MRIVKIEGRNRFLFFVCRGFNFEMEVARLTGKIKENYFCINDTPLLPPWAQ